LAAQCDVLPGFCEAGVRATGIGGIGWPVGTIVTFFSTTGVRGLSFASRCTRAMV